MGGGHVCMAIEPSCAWWARVHGDGQGLKISKFQKFLQMPFSSDFLVVRIFKVRFNYSNELIKLQSFDL